MTLVVHALVLINIDSNMQGDEIKIKIYTHTSVSFYWQNKFAIKAFLCNTPYFYIVDSGLQLNNTHRMNRNNGYAKLPQC